MPDFYDERGRLLALENKVHSYETRFRLVLLGYFILAVGVVIAFVILGSNADRIDRQSDQLEAAAGAYCVAGLRRDDKEDIAIHKLAVGKPIQLPKDCLLIVKRLHDE